jgi:2-oxoglutarate dehydrogenase E1 component
LRHPAVTSSPKELSEGRFQAVIDDWRAHARPKEVRRLILCSGKVFVDIDTSEQRAGAREVAVCRVEQLYPFPLESIHSVIAGYPELRDVVWLQEEPENMGAWEFVRPLLEQSLEGRVPLRYVGRARSSSPSEGSAAWHHINQKALIGRAFDFTTPEQEPSLVLSKEA